MLRELRRPHTLGYFVQLLHKVGCPVSVKDYTTYEKGSDIPDWVMQGICRVITVGPVPCRPEYCYLTNAADMRGDKSMDEIAIEWGITTMQYWRYERGLDMFPSNKVPAGYTFTVAYWGFSR